MNFAVIVIGFFAVLAALAPLPTAGLRRCTTTTPCATTTTVCGQLGLSNKCKLFQDACALDQANCARLIPFNTVAASLCTGFTTNQRGQCGGTAG